MSYTYQIIANHSGETTKTDISEQQFNIYNKAKEVLEHALLIEQKYDTVIHNYLELEKTVLSIAADYSVRNNLDYEDFFNVRQILNIQLINFFAGTFLYLESVSHNAKHCLGGDNDICKKIKEWKSDEYDDNPNYRFMDTFRNYVHHYEFPVNKTSQGAKNIYLETTILQEFYVEFFVSKKIILQNKSFKKSVLDGFEEEIDLLETTKSYMKSIFDIHKKIREHISQPVRESREIIEKLLSEYPSTKIVNHGFVSILKKEGNYVKDDIPFLLEWDDIRIKFQKRNRNLTNLEIRYISSGTKKNRKQK